MGVGIIGGQHQEFLANRRDVQDISLPDKFAFPAPDVGKHLKKPFDTERFFDFVSLGRSLKMNFPCIFPC